MRQGRTPSAPTARGKVAILRKQVQRARATPLHALRLFTLTLSPWYPQSSPHAPLSSPAAALRDLGKNGSEEGKVSLDYHESGARTSVCLSPSRHAPCKSSHSFQKVCLPASNLPPSPWTEEGVNASPLPAPGLGPPRQNPTTSPSRRPKSAFKGIAHNNASAHECLRIMHDVLESVKAISEGATPHLQGLTRHFMTPASRSPRRRDRHRRGRLDQFPPFLDAGPPPRCDGSYDHRIKSLSHV